MKINALVMLLAVIAPTVGNAQFTVDALKDSVPKPARAVSETTGGVLDAVGKTTERATTAVKQAVDATTQSLRDEATREATGAKLDAMAETTLTRLFAEQAGSRALFDRSAGYAVFDKREASFYVVAGYGRGVAVTKETGARVYMKMATTGAGLSFGLGGFASQLVILFENNAEFQEFITQGLDATAEVGAMAGEEKEQLAMRFNEGKAMFVLTGKGWKIAAKLTGSRYWPDDELNAR